MTAEEAAGRQPGAPVPGFATDEVARGGPGDDAGPAREEVAELPAEGGTAVTGDLSVLATRPSAAPPREYHFPHFERTSLAGGLTVLTAHLPGRPLLSAQLLLRGGSGGGITKEPAERAGVTVLMARALSEGTRERDAVALIEASERLGAELSADAGWDSFAASVEVPRSHFAPALALLAEMALQPSFPEAEVTRLREERLNDLMQARADPRRRSERLFPEQVYAPESPYSRPPAGTEDTVPGIDRNAVAARHAALMRAGASTLLVCGDLTGIDVAARAAEALVEWPSREAAPVVPPIAAVARSDAPRVLVVDRPAAPQTEIRLGHIGLPRSIPDFHALSVMNTILGGLFNSRLNLLLREKRGYTYGAHSGFDLRRSAGPFVVRCAVTSQATVPAVGDILSVLKGMQDAPVSDEELTVARDYLVGVFPLRFEAAGQVAAALGGLVVFELPDDELDNYRPKVAAVTAEDVLRAARAHLHPDEARIVLVGDAAVIEPALADADLGEVLVVREGLEPADAA
jgi:zinc protease